MKKLVLALAFCLFALQANGQGWYHSGYDLEATRFNPNASQPLADPTAPFEVAWSQSVSCPYSGQFWILTGDINGDSNLEVITFPYMSGTISAFTSDGSPLWQTNVAADAGVSGLVVHGGELADVDNDGLKEVIVGCGAGSEGSNGAARILVYNGNGILERSPIVLPNCWRVDNIRGVDLDGNGTVELVASILSGYPLAPRGIYLYDYASGSQLWSFETGPDPTNVAIGDINGDGYLDIVTGFFAPHNGHTANGLSDSYSYILALDRNGNELWHRQIGSETANPTIADLTGNGTKEIVVVKLQYSYSGTNEIQILAGVNGGLLASYAGTTRWDWAAVGDLNNDGTSEIAAADWSNTVHILDHNAQLLYSGSGGRQVQALNDLTGNGNVEVITNSPSSVAVFDNNLDLLWSYTVSPQGAAAVVSDLEGDGVNEILVAADLLYCLRSGALAPPEVPSLVAPADGESFLATSSVAFEWTKVDWATEYAIEFSNNSETSSEPIAGRPAGTFTSITAYVPLGDVDSWSSIQNYFSEGTYYWHIMASNNTIEGLYSSAKSFTIGESPETQIVTARYCNTSAFNHTLHANVTERVYLPCWVGAEFDSRIGEFLASDVDVIFVGGDDSFSQTTADQIENAVFNDGKILVIAYWADSRFDACLPATKQGTALSGSGIVAGDLADPVVATILDGVPTSFSNAGPNYTRRFVSPKPGARVITRFTLDNSSALLVWRYGAGAVIYTTLEQPHQFYGLEYADKIIYQAILWALGRQPLPDIPSLVAPADGDDFSPTSSIGFEWTKVDWATEYAIEFSNNSETSSEPIAGRPVGTFTSITAYVPLGDVDSWSSIPEYFSEGTYYWHVMASCDTIAGLYSSARSFTISRIPEDWPTFCHDDLRTSMTTEEVLPPYRMSWNGSAFNTGAAIRAPAIVVGDVIYFANCGGYVYAVDINTGTQIWSRNLGTVSEVWASPVYWNGKLYIATYNMGSSGGVLYCLNANNGNNVWGPKRLSGYGLITTPTIVGDKILVYHHETTYVYNAATGANVNSYEVAGQQSPAANWNGKAYFNGYYITEYDPVTNTFAQGYATGRQSAVAISSDGHIYFNNNAFLASYNLNTHQLDWVSSQYFPYGQPPKQIALSENLVILTYNNQIHAVNRSNGEHVWSASEFEYNGTFDFQSPIIAGNTVLITSQNGGNLYCWDLQTGNPLGVYHFTEDAYASPIVAKGRVIVGCDNGSLYGLEHGEETKTTLTVRAFNDANGDGKPNLNELDLEGLGVHLSDGQNGVTGPGGLCSFTVDAPAEYTIKVDVPEGYSNTTPNPRTVTAYIGSSNYNFFGFQKAPVLTLTPSTFGPLSQTNPTVTFTVNLTGHGAPLAGRSIRIESYIPPTGTPGLMETVTTDANGNAPYTWSVEHGVENPEYQVNFLAKFEGDNEWGPAADTSYGSVAARYFTVTLDAPADGENITLPYTFRWHGSFATGEVTYTIQFAQNSDFTPVIYENSVVTTDVNVGLEIPAGPLVIDGVYYWRVIANRPDRDPVISESRSFSFTPGAPDIAVSANYLDFGDVEQGQTQEMILTLENQGTGPLTATFEISPDDFSIPTSSVGINPNSHYDLVISLIAPSNDFVFGRLTITTNDPDEQTVLVNLFANKPAGITATVITLETDETEVNTGDTVRFSLRLTDAMGSPLSGRPLTVGWIWEDDLIPPGEWQPRNTGLDGYYPDSTWYADFLPFDGTKTVQLWAEFEGDEECLGSYVSVDILVNETIARIEGTIFIDNNDNGIYDAGDEALPGQRVRMVGYQVEPNYEVEVLTDDDGTYWDAVPQAYYYVIAEGVSCRREVVTEDFSQQIHMRVATVDFPVRSWEVELSAHPDTIPDNGWVLVQAKVLDKGEPVPALSVGFGCDRGTFLEQGTGNFVNAETGPMGYAMIVWRPTEVVHPGQTMTAHLTCRIDCSRPPLWDTTVVVEPYKPSSLVPMCEPTDSFASESHLTWTEIRTGHLCKPPRNVYQGEEMNMVFTIGRAVGLEDPFNLPTLKEDYEITFSVAKEEGCEVTNPDLVRSFVYTLSHWENYEVAHDLARAHFLLCNILALDPFELSLRSWSCWVGGPLLAEWLRGQTFIYGAAPFGDPFTDNEAYDIQSWVWDLFMLNAEAMQCLVPVKFTKPGQAIIHTHVSYTYYTWSQWIQNRVGVQHDDITFRVAPFAVVGKSPIDIELTDPRGEVYNKVTIDALEAFYRETEGLEDVLGLFCPRQGLYCAKVIPDSSATPNDIYSLFAMIEGDTTWLAKEVQIERLPSRGYSFNTLPYASLSGFVIADSSQGLRGVNVDVYDSLGTLWQSVATDDSGFYHIDSIPNGDYSVTVTTPIGYQTDQETKEFTIHHIPVTVDFNLTKLDITPQQRSRAYWAHQLCRALRNRPKDYTKGDFSGFGNLICQHFNKNVVNPVQVYVVPEGATQEDSLNVLKERLTFRCLEEGEPFLKRIARGQLVALMLNGVSGKISQTEPITRDSMNVSQAITYCDMLIYDLDCPIGDVPNWFLPGFPKRDELIRYIKASFVAGLINVGVKLPAGAIPPDIDDIAYKYVAGQTPVPDDYSLNQNYPNPFNPMTEIKYGLPEDCWVTLEIYDILGRRVTSLVNQRQTAGYKSVRWDASSIASGIYFYRLQAGDFVQARKMILIR